MSQEKEREHFKKQLFQNFKESGVLDFLKAQVRTSFVEKLKHKENTPSSQKKDRSSEKKFTPKKHKDESYNQMAVTLVLDFLEKNKFVYTNSVFLPEAKNIAQPISKDQLLDSIDPKKALFVSEDKPYLCSILEYLIAALKQQETVPKSHKKGSVEKALSFSDDSVEDRFYKFKQEYEERMRDEIKAEVERIKKFELMNIRIEEGEKARVKMEEFRVEVEKNYNEKVQKLRDKEKEIIEKFKAQLKGLEMANEEQKKTHFKDVESYKIMRDEMEGFMNKEKQALMAERDRVSKLERDLNKKIAEVQAEKDAIIKQTELLVKSAKAEAIKDIDRERSTIFKMKAQVENDLEKIGVMRDRAENAEFQNKRLLEINDHLSKELEQARDKIRDIELDLHHKKDSVDYYKTGFDRDGDQLKKLEKQIEIFKEQVKEHEKGKEEIRNQLEHKRRELVDSNQRYIREIESYQQLVERVSREKDALRRRIAELEDEVKHLILNRSTHKSQVHEGDNSKLEEGESKDFMEASFGENDPRMKQVIQEVNASHRRTEIDSEIKQLKQRREQEVATLMMEPAITKSVLRKKESQEESPLKRSLVESVVTGSVVTGSGITGSSVRGSFANVSFRPLDTRDKSDIAAIRQYYSRNAVDRPSHEERNRISWSDQKPDEPARGNRFEDRKRDQVIKITESFDEDLQTDLITRSKYSPLSKERRAISNEHYNKTKL